MKKYIFYDTDSTGHEQFDITGVQYFLLLQACFKYSFSFSIILSPDFSGDIEKWEKYRIPVSGKVRDIYPHYATESYGKSRAYEIRHYRLTPEMCDLIVRHTDSLFSWLCGWGFDNPDDPAFFREDGSVFFSSVIHEGECTLNLKDNEFLPDGLLDEKWIKESS